MQVPDGTLFWQTLGIKGQKIYVIIQYFMVIICMQANLGITTPNYYWDDQLWLPEESMIVSAGLVKNSVMQDTPGIKHIITDVINYQYTKHKVKRWNTS